MSFQLKVLSVGMKFAHCSSAWPVLSQSCTHSLLKQCRAQDIGSMMREGKQRRNVNKDFKIAPSSPSKIATNDTITKNHEIC